MSLLPTNWLSFITFLQNAQTLMLLVSLALTLSTISLLILVVSFVKQKCKLITKS